MKCYCVELHSKKMAYKVPPIAKLGGSLNSVSMYVRMRVLVPVSS